MKRQNSNAHESLSIFIILKNSSILKFSVMICPMTKHFSQFPFSQSCIKFQVVWFLPGPGEGERWGQESGVCLSTRASIDLSSVLSALQSWSLDLLLNYLLSPSPSFLWLQPMSSKGMDSFAAILGWILEVVLVGTSGLKCRRIVLLLKNSPLFVSLFPAVLIPQSTPSLTCTSDTSLIQCEMQALLP